MIVFEDDRVARLAPVTLGRPAFSISCGGYRLIDLLKSLGEPVETVVRPHLRELQTLDGGSTPPQERRGDGPTLWINARVVPTPEALRQIRSLKSAGRLGRVHGPAGLAAALLPGNVTRPEDAGDFAPLEADLPLLEYPHDIVRHHQTHLGANLEHRLAEGGYAEIADGVFARPDALLGEHVVTDTRKGPIVLEAGASVGPFCLLRGPVHVGAHARVTEHAALKDGVSLGHTTKIGGEVEASIIEPYTNKQHHGFLGHSYLGSWINLGAGTCNSDLKNTYGKVNMTYGGQRVETGMQFLGCILGDYAKTAINTSIFTGKTVGVCSMLYGFVTTNVPSFVNYARSFGQVTEAPVEVMIATQARMFLRRGVHQRACDIQLLRDMFELTRAERAATGDVLPPEPLTL